MAWQRWLIVAAMPTLMVAGLALLFSRSQPKEAAPKFGPTASQRPADAPVFARQLDEPGISDPEFVDPEEADLAPDDPVIGVIVDGQPRAYLQLALSGVAKKHVVSDVTSIGRITVTHCDLSRCTRVFIEDAPAGHKQIRVGGLQANRSLELLIDGRRYSQRDENIPLPEYPFAETSWENWLAEHPETKVYVGERSDG
jgi:hypothetical protein